MGKRLIKSVRKNKQIKSFTYFIPSPPARKNGYREKELDKILNGILQSGFEIMEFRTEATDTGVFIFTLLHCPTDKVAKLDLNLDIQEKFKLENRHASPDIEIEEDIDESL